MSGYDPIERLREVFDSIEPRDGAMRRWEENLSAARGEPSAISRQPSTEGMARWASGTGPLGEIGAHNRQPTTHSALSTQRPARSTHAFPEPLPWRLLIGSASAAAASIALLAVGVFDPPGGSSDLAAAPVRVTHTAMAAAEPVMDAPAPDGTKWRLHWPSLGIDVKESLHTLSAAFLSPFRSGA